MKAETTSYSEAFGDVLKRVRQHRHLSPEQLAANSVVPLSRILRIESGMTEPSLSELFLLCGALKVKPSSFVEGVELVIYGALSNRPQRSGANGEGPSASLQQSRPAQTRSEDTGQ